MSRGRALITEILARPHEAAPKEGLPLPVDGDSADQWIAGIDQPSRESQPVAWKLRGKRAEQRRNSRLHCLLRLQKLAPFVNEGLPRIVRRSFVKDERRRQGRFLRSLGSQLFARLIERRR